MRVDINRFVFIHHCGNFRVYSFEYLLRISGKKLKVSFDPWFPGEEDTEESSNFPFHSLTFGVYNPDCLDYDYFGAWLHGSVKETFRIKGAIQKSLKDFLTSFYLPYISFSVPSPNCNQVRVSIYDRLSTFWAKLGYVLIKRIVTDYDEIIWFYSLEGCPCPFTSSKEEIENHLIGGVSYELRI